MVRASKWDMHIGQFFLAICVCSVLRRLSMRSRQPYAKKSAENAFDASVSPIERVIACLT